MRKNILIRQIHESNDQYWSINLLRMDPILLQLPWKEPKIVLSHALKSFLAYYKTKFRNQSRFNVKQLLIYVFMV